MNIMRWFFSFHGRIGRHAFIFGYLIVAALCFAIGRPLMSVIMGVHVTGTLTLYMKGVQTVYLCYTLYILGFIANLSLASLVVKRLHDMEVSGYWALGAISANFSVRIYWRKVFCHLGIACLVLDHHPLSLLFDAGSVFRQTKRQCLRFSARKVLIASS